MKIQTMSIVCGTRKCNAKCPFCVSSTTFPPHLSTDVNWRNFHIACKLAKQSNATTVLLTGKGEPTLYPSLITSYLAQLKEYDFPFIELQTNGIKLEDRKYIERNLPIWYSAGLTTICLSAIHIKQIYNEEIYGPAYPPIEEVVKTLHDIGFTTRLSIMLVKGYGMDCVQGIESLISFCKMHKIKQLTVRPIAAPENSTSKEAKWARENTIDPEVLDEIKEHIRYRATPVLNLAHGGVVYDYEGQNICLTDCLTTNKTEDDMRQIIFYPDGTISYDWKYKGAVLL